MSTARNVTMALAGAKSAYDAWSNFSDRKAEEAYESLRDAATQYGPRADAAVQRAGEATQSARERLEKTLDRAGQQTRKEGKKLSRKGRKQAAKVEKKARKTADKAAKKANKKQKGGMGTFSKLTLWTLILSVVGIVVYVLLNRQSAPKQAPVSVPAQEPTPVAEKASDEEVEQTLAGDETFSDVEPEEVKVDHAEGETKNDAEGDEQK